MKIRLHGTRGEVAWAVDRLNETFRLVSVSEPYADRGRSSLVRVYAEVRMPAEISAEEPDR